MASAHFRYRGIGNFVYSVPMQRRVTIKDVAAQAGVTDMTVSRVVNSSGPVSEKVRLRVEAAISDLGYIPNQLARGLRLKRTNTLALIVSDVTNPFFTTVARGVEDAASDAKNLVLLCNTDESEPEELRYVEMLAQQRVDGILLVPARTGQPAHELASRLGMPMLILDRHVKLRDISVVRCDSYGGAADMAKYLFDLGHRRFCIIAGPTGMTTSDDRIAGFVTALNGLDVQVEVLHGGYSPESGRELVEKAVALNPRPTALFASNNFLTIGALQGLYKMGIKVPDEITLTGFDDLPPSLVAAPFLTVVDQPAYQMGHRAVELLLKQLDSPDFTPTEIVLPTELILRSSSGPPV